MSVTKKLQVGGDIVYRCSRCQLELGHTIMAMMNGEPVRLRCNTCKTERNYKAPKRVVPDSIADRPSRTMARPRYQHSEFYDQKMRDSLTAPTKTYRADESFAVGDNVQHPTFGKGVVTKLIFPDRMDVLFKEENKILMRKADAAS